MRNVALEELCQRCRLESERFRRDEPNDPRYCLEIFRRALLRSNAVGAESHAIFLDELARSALVEIYTTVFHAEFGRCKAPYTQFEDMAQTAWLRFWRWARDCPEEPFENLPAAISFLKRIALSVVIKEGRQARAESRTASLNALLDDGQAGVLADMHGDEFSEQVKRLFREAVRRVLADPLEYRIYCLRYDVGVPPREMAHMFKAEGIQIKERAPTARLISDMLARAMKRLEADDDIRDLLTD